MRGRLLVDLVELAVDLNAARLQVLVSRVLGGRWSLAAAAGQWEGARDW